MVVEEDEKSGKDRGKIISCIKDLLPPAHCLVLLQWRLALFGAHGLKKIVQQKQLQTFQTGVQYQMYHALALLLTGLLYENVLKICRIAGVLL
jgi:uncharacterized membrane protein YgdD (TMEM256/DUF423 family)